jgi:hypothetical protein
MSYIKIQLTLATSEESIELYKDYEVHVRVTHSILSESSNHKNNSKEIPNAWLENCRSGYIKTVKVRSSV